MAASDMALTGHGSDAAPEHDRQQSAPPHRDPSLELFGGSGDDADERVASTSAYTGRHRAPEAH